MQISVFCIFLLHIVISAFWFIDTPYIVVNDGCRVIDGVTVKTRITVAASATSRHSRLQITEGGRGKQSINFPRQKYPSSMHSYTLYGK